MKTHSQSDGMTTGAANVVPPGLLSPWGSIGSFEVALVLASVQTRDMSFRRSAGPDHSFSEQMPKPKRDKEEGSHKKQVGMHYKKEFSGGHSPLGQFTKIRFYRIKRRKMISLMKTCLADVQHHSFGCSVFN